MSMRRQNSSVSQAISEPSEQALWQEFIDHLRVLPPLDFPTLMKLNDSYPRQLPAHPDLDGHDEVSASSIPDTTIKKAVDRGSWASRGEMLAAWETEARRSRKQQKILDRAYNSLEQLINLKRSAPDSSSLDSARKNKRKALSPTPSFSSSRLASPLPPSSSSSSTRSYNAREHLRAQLPLLPGRRVVCKEPKPPGRPEGGDQGPAESNWILAYVVKMNAGDKHRYEVVDADEENGKKKFNTTIKHIIPLADPSAPPSSPSHPNQYRDLPAGTTVLAWYPDTTAFYNGTVVQPPLKGTGMGIPAPPSNDSRARPVAGQYVIEFQDDDGKMTQVAADMVVEHPGTS